MNESAQLASMRAALRRALPELREAYGVDYLAVFGSVARREASSASDVDLLVRFRGEPRGVLGFVRLERSISEILGLPVDLVMETAVKPRLRERILAEAVAA